MNRFIFLDAVWKCLFTFTVSNTLALMLILMGYLFLKRHLSKVNLKRFLNLQALFLICFTMIGTIVLNVTDPEIVAACFNKFANISDSFRVTRIIAFGYLSTLAFLLFFDLISTLISIRIHRHLPKVENRQINSVLTKLMSQINMKTPLTVYLNNNSSSPYVWGLLRPVLVVNSRLLDKTKMDSLDAIASHELMHIKGRDSMWLLLSYFTKRLLFFNPLSLIFYNIHRGVVEMAADEGAVDQCKIESRNLFAAIIDLAEKDARQRGSVLQVNASRDFSEIKHRMQALSANRIKGGKCSSLVYLSVAVTSILVIAQAKRSIASFDAKNVADVRVCSQAQHEMIFKKLLKIEAKINKCD